MLGVRFTKDGDEKGIPVGTAELYIDDKPVGQARIRTQPGHFALTGEGLCVGRDGGQAVSSDYAAPFEFTGGTIRQVAVDVSSEAYLDVEKELAGMFARD